MTEEDAIAIVWEAYDTREDDGSWEDVDGVYDAIDLLAPELVDCSCDNCGDYECSDVVCRMYNIVSKYPRRFHPEPEQYTSYDDVVATWPTA